MVSQSFLDIWRKNGWVSEWQRLVFYSLRILEFSIGWCFSTCSLIFALLMLQFASTFMGISRQTIHNAASRDNKSLWLCALRCFQRRSPRTYSSLFLRDPSLSCLASGHLSLSILHVQKIQDEECLPNKFVSFRVRWQPEHCLTYVPEFLRPFYLIPSSMLLNFI